MLRLTARIVKIHSMTVVNKFKIESQLLRSLQVFQKRQAGCCGSRYPDEGHHDEVGKEETDNNITFLQPSQAFIAGC